MATLYIVLPKERLGKIVQLVIFKSTEDKRHVAYDDPIFRHRGATYQTREVLQLISRLWLVIYQRQESYSSDIQTPRRNVSNTRSASNVI